MTLLCVGCGRPVRPGKGEFLFLRPDGSEAWLHHGRRCADLYNPDLPAQVSTVNTSHRTGQDEARP